MTDEIVALPGVTKMDAPWDEQPQEQVIELLEEALAEARSGKIQSIGLALVCRGQRTTYRWSISVGCSHSLFAAIGDMFFNFGRSRSDIIHDPAPLPGDEPA